MDSLIKDKPFPRTRLIILGGVGLGIVLLFILKAIQLGWFLPKQQVIPSDTPVIVFFIRSRGCDCALEVYQAATAQIDNWSDDNRHGVPLVTVDLDRRPDLGKMFGIVRTPALVLLDAHGGIVYMQKESLSDDTPLDLTMIEGIIAKSFTAP